MQLWISIEISAVIFLISVMLFLVQLYGQDIIHPLGFTCMTFNILNFGAPLAGLVSLIPFFMHFAYLRMCK